MRKRSTPIDLGKDFKQIPKYAYSNHQGDTYHDYSHWTAYEERPFEVEKDLHMFIGYVNVPNKYPSGWKESFIECYFKYLDLFKIYEFNTIKFDYLKSISLSYINDMLNDRAYIIRFFEPENRRRGLLHEFEYINELPTWHEK